MTTETKISNIIPNALGTYSILDATLYIYATTPKKIPLTTKHLYYWTRDGLAGGYLKGVRNRQLFINFRDLVSLRIVAAMRAQGIKHKEIVMAEKELQKVFGWDYPFAMSDFWVAKPDIYMKIQGILLSVSRHLQYAMDLIEEYIVPVHGLSFDLFGVSSAWKPHDDILLNPEIQYGSPCIEGTRVPSEVIWSLSDAGDSVDSIAFMYGLQRKQIDNAIEWEKILGKAS